MHLIGLMPARNEAWCIGFTARAALRWLDQLIVLNHASTDATAEIVGKIADEHPGRVAILNEHRPEWDEANYRQRLLNHGRRLGGTCFAIIDADEVLTGNLLPSIRHMAECLHPRQCLRLPWLCLWRSLDRYRDDDSPFGRAFAPVLFRDDPGLSHRALNGGYQLHTRMPAGCVPFDLTPRSAGLLHLQHVVWSRVTAKQRLYAMTEMVRWGKGVEEVNRRYGPATDESGLRLAEVPRSWWEPYGDRSGIRLDAEPWQHTERERLLHLYGRERFAGLKG